MTAGAVFTIYAPLPPSVFSVGGIFLALAMLGVARFYNRLLDLENFYRISVLVEGVMVGLILLFLLFPAEQNTALLIYAGYQFTFTFGAYLVRAETMAFRKRQLLSWIDVRKQAGYLAGMAVAWLFYLGLEKGWGITENAGQVYALHWLLLAWEGVTLYWLLKSFGKKGAVGRL